MCFGFHIAKTKKKTGFYTIKDFDQNILLVLKITSSYLAFMKKGEAPI